jgi:hypothetical protein
LLVDQPSITFSQWKIMGGARRRLEWQMPSAAVSDNCWAINYNPAGLAALTAFQCSAFIVPEQFGLQELRTTAFAAAKRIDFATIGMKTEKFGFDLYSETEFGLALASMIDSTYFSRTQFPISSA